MILVTGALGFIGSCLVKALNDVGQDDLVLVDRFSDDDRFKNLINARYFEFFNADDFIQENLESLAGNITAIYHMGAISDTTFRDGQFLLKNNVDFTKDLIGFALEHDIPIIYASSAATYGNGEYGYLDNDDQVAKLRPLNPYGYSKQMVDEWLMQLNLPPTSRVYGVKFFNVYGPNEYHKGKMSSVVYQAHQQIKNKGVVNLFKSYHPDFPDGGQKRDFIYVKDAILGMLRLMKTESATSGIYNLGSGVARTFHDLVAATFNALNQPVKINFIEMPESIKNQYQYFTEAPMGKLEKTIGLLNFKSLEENVKDYVQNYLESSSPYIAQNIGKFQLPSSHLSRKNK